MTPVTSVYASSASARRVFAQLSVGRAAAGLPASPSLPSDGSPLVYGPPAVAHCVVGRGHVSLSTNLDTWHSKAFSDRCLSAAASSRAAEYCLCSGRDSAPRPAQWRATTRRTSRRGRCSGTTRRATAGRTPSTPTRTGASTCVTWRAVTRRRPPLSRTARARRVRSAAAPQQSGSQRPQHI
jgi:hypothetical protein